MTIKLPSDAACHVASGTSSVRTARDDGHYHEPRCLAEWASQCQPDAYAAAGNERRLSHAPIALAVGSIVLVVVGNEVGQGEAVMGGDEVN